MVQLEDPGPPNLSIGPDRKIASAGAVNSSDIERVKEICLNPHDSGHKMDHMVRQSLIIQRLMYHRKLCCQYKCTCRLSAEAQMSPKK